MTNGHDSPWPGPCRTWSTHPRSRRWACVARVPWSHSAAPTRSLSQTPARKHVAVQQLSTCSLPQRHAWEQGNCAAELLRPAKALKVMALGAAKGADRGLQCTVVQRGPTAVPSWSWASPQSSLPPPPLQHSTRRSKDEFLSAVSTATIQGSSHAKSGLRGRAASAAPLARPLPCRRMGGLLLPRCRARTPQHAQHA